MGTLKIATLNMATLVSHLEQGVVRPCPGDRRVEGVGGVARLGLGGGQGGGGSVPGQSAGC